MRRRSSAVPAALVALALAALPAAARAQHEDEHASHGSAARPPALTDADRAAAFPDLGDATHEMMEDPFRASALFDRLELQDRDGAERASLDVDAWFGRDLQRLWLRGSAERAAGSTERAQLTLLYGRGFARWWEWVAGVRRDFDPGPSRMWAAFGLQGLAPYRFQIEATAFVGDGGRSAARLEAEYELLITNRWILQPLVEIDWYGRSDPERGIGSGLASAAAGLRLRYEIRREVAPYVGVLREQRFGSTADLARAAGEDTDDSRVVLGVRLWF